MLLISGHSSEILTKTATLVGCFGVLVWLFSDSWVIFADPQSEWGLYLILLQIPPQLPNFIGFYSRGLANRQLQQRVLKRSVRLAMPSKPSMGSAVATGRAGQHRWAAERLPVASRETPRSLLTFLHLLSPQQLSGTVSVKALGAPATTGLK
jgi:hypothetical protein